MSLEFLPGVPVDNESAFGAQQATRHYPNVWWISLLRHLCVIQSWLNNMAIYRTISTRYFCIVFCFVLFCRKYYSMLRVFSKYLMYLLGMVNFAQENVYIFYIHYHFQTKIVLTSKTSHKSLPFQIARFMGPTGGPLGSCRPQLGPMLAPWTLLLGITTDDLEAPEAMASAAASLTLFSQNILGPKRKKIDEYWVKLTDDRNIIWIVNTIICFSNSTLQVVMQLKYAVRSRYCQL